MTATETTTLHAAHHDKAEEAAVAGLGLGIALRAAELTLALLVGLIFCPPLLILAVAVIVPAFILGVLGALVVAVCAAPVLLVRHVRRHHRTHGTSALTHGLRSIRARAA